jgi:hypothetical protein
LQVLIPFQGILCCLKLTINGNFCLIEDLVFSLTCLDIGASKKPVIYQV